MVGRVVGKVKDGVCSKGLMGAVMAGAVMLAGNTQAGIIDLTGAGTTLVADATSAAGEGLPVFTAIFGIRVVVKAFMMIAG